MQQPNITSKCHVVEQLPSADHCAVLFEIPVDISANELYNKARLKAPLTDYNSVNFTATNNDAARVNWNDPLLTASSVDQCCASFAHTALKITYLCAPCLKVTNLSPTSLETCSKRVRFIPAACMRHFAKATRNVPNRYKFLYRKLKTALPHGRAKREEQSDC